MPAYHFILFEGAAQTERLGSIELRDDTDAVAFGEQVIRDMKRSGPVLCAGWTMKIMEGERTAGEVLFATAGIGSSPSELTSFEI